MLTFFSILLLITSKISWVLSDTNLPVEQTAPHLNSITHQTSATLPPANLPSDQTKSMEKNPNNATPIITDPLQTNAVVFASEAGKIAGIVQACGTDPLLLIERSQEVIEKLALDPMDKTLSLLTLLQVQRQSVVNFKNPDQVSYCPEAIKLYESLPVLQRNYKEEIIDKLTTFSP